MPVTPKYSLFVEFSEAARQPFVAACKLLGSGNTIVHIGFETAFKPSDVCMFEYATAVTAQIV